MPGRVEAPNPRPSGEQASVTESGRETVLAGIPTSDPDAALRFCRLLSELLGAAHVINGKKTDPVAAVVELTKGGAHVAVDALGIAATCRGAIMSLRKQGRHLQIGLTTHAEQGEIPLPIDRMVTMELQVIASLGMQASHSLYSRFRWTFFEPSAARRYRRRPYT